MYPALLPLMALSRAPADCPGHRRHTELRGTFREQGLKPELIFDGTHPVRGGAHHGSLELHEIRLPLFHDPPDLFLNAIA